MRLQQYVNWKIPDVQGGFRKGRGTRKPGVLQSMGVANSWTRMSDWLPLRCGREINEFNAKRSKDVLGWECQDGHKPGCCDHLRPELGVSVKGRPDLAPDMWTDDMCARQRGAKWGNSQRGHSWRKKQHREMPGGEGRVHWGLKIAQCDESIEFGEKERGVTWVQSVRA